MVSFTNFDLSESTQSNQKTTGQLLMSTGDDATIRTWKKDVDGEWDEYAEIDVETLQQEESGENASE